MKFAIVDGQRRKAQLGLAAKCPVCDAAMIAKCGQLRAPHWAHQGTRTCDHWWEPETEWHRAWKDRFPKEWQEIVQRSKDGEKHIADVKTERAVLEFQHSFLNRDERESREAFYKDMVWVVNGRRRVRDRAQFFASMGAAMVVNPRPLILSAPSNGCALLRDWQASRVPVYFDFGDNQPDDPIHFDMPILWRLSSRTQNGRACLSAVAKASFVHVHRTGSPFEARWTKTVEYAVAGYLMRQAARSGPLIGFGRYMARRQRARRRF